MKVTLRAAVGGLLPAAAAILVLTGCTSQNEVNQEYLVTANVKSVSCKTVNVTDLQAAVNFVNAANSRQTNDILERNPGESSLEPLQTTLNNKIQECTGGDKPADTPENDEPKIGLVAQNGSGGELPLFDGNGKVIDNGDSTKQPETPPVASEALLQRCGKKFTNWEQLADCVGGDEWYKKGAATMEPYTGFLWGDIQKWAKAKEDVNGNAVTDIRLIHVYGWTPQQKSAEQAQMDVRELTNNTALRVVYHNEDMPNGLVNSRGLERNTVSPFADQQKQVRVSLAPLVLNEKSQIVGLRTDAGVFVDCLNYWGKAFAIAPAPGKPVLCPPNSGMPGQPIPPSGPSGCNPPPPTTTIPPPPPCVGSGCNPPPPCVGTGCNPKKPNEGSNHNGNAPQGGGQKQNPGAGTLEPPPPVVTTTHNNPPAPPPAGPPAGSTPTTGAPPPTNPGAGTSNSGTVPPPP